MHRLLAQALAITPRGFQRRLVLICIFSSVLALFDAALVVLAGPAVDSVVASATPEFFGVRLSLRTLGILIVGMLVLKNLLQIALSRWKHRVLFTLQAHLSSEALSAVLDVDFRRSSWLSSGKKSSYVINEPLQAILNVYTNVVSLTTELSVIVMVTASLLIVRPVETLQLFAVLGLLIGGFQWSTRGWLQRSGARRKDADAQRHELVRAVVDSEADVRAMKLQSKVRQLYRGANDSSSFMVANKAFATEIVKNVVELAVVAGVALLVLGAARTASVEEMAPLLAVFGAAAYRLAPSFNRLMVCTQSIRFGIPSLEVVHQLLVAAPRMTQAPPAVETLGEVCIEVDELTSPSGVTLVRDRSLRLVKGDVLLVSGPSGIGKSTLVKALIDGSPGVRISVNGRRLEQGLTQAGIAVGMAGQRALVFPASLADNVLPQDAAAAAGSQRVAEVVSSLADRHKGSILDESIVLQHLEREVTPANLSGGQAQRIALMRAVLCGNDLLLFDEPTSALDTSSRDRFMELIRAIARTRIVVIVSHDLELQAVATQTLTLRAEQ